MSGTRPSPFNRPIPPEYPIFGADAFRTATGVHASAIVKANRLGDKRIAELVYSSVPASLVGRGQRIELGPTSGRANAEHWLTTHGYPAIAQLVVVLLYAAKSADRVLRDPEIHSLIAVANSSSSVTYEVPEYRRTVTPK
jgi:2-isopropylmalate synthase